jgi:hypothetical protein
MEVTVVAATGTVNERGPLSVLIAEYGQAQGRSRVDGKVSPEAWAEVGRFVDTDRFLRVDTDLSEMDWAAYTAMLTGGPLGKGQPGVGALGGVTKLEKTRIVISEVGDTVFQEVEEFHHYGERVVRKNMLAVYRFTPERKIHRLDIYEQAAPPKG